MKKSGVDGNALKEATFINKSLSALGNVFEALEQKSSHVPYRDSKLTFLLKDSLGGDSKALMLVQISPSSDNSMETLCSLRFASKVHSIELGPIKRNFDLDASRFKDEAKKAKDELKEKDTFIALLQQKCEELDAKANQFESAYHELEFKFEQLNETFQNQMEESNTQNNDLSLFLDNSSFHTTPSRFYTSLKETVEEFEGKENYQENRFRTPTKSSLGAMSPAVKKLKRPVEEVPVFGNTPFQRPTKKPTLNPPKIQISTPSSSTAHTPTSKPSKYVHNSTPIRVGDIFNETNGPVTIGMNYFNLTSSSSSTLNPKLKGKRNNNQGIGMSEQNSTVIQSHQQPLTPIRTSSKQTIIPQWK